jgi:hypothetical protein
MVITSHPRGTADRGRSAQPKKATQRETGSRRISWGHFFRVSGLGRLVPGSGVQVRVQVQEICHLSSVIDAAIFPFRVAGGGPGWRVAGDCEAVTSARGREQDLEVLREQLTRGAAI